VKNPTPILIARISTLIISIFILIVLICTKIFFSEQLNWYIVILVPVLIFVAGYFVFYYAIENFIYRKIKLIYKSIYDTKSPKKSKRGKFRLRKDVLDDAESEVFEWKKKKEKELKKMKELEFYRKEFLGNVFHELKTPVFNIQGYLETLIEGGIRDDNINNRFLQRANKNVKRIINIVNDLQMIANLEDGSFLFNAEKLDIYKFAAEIMDSLEILAKAKNISLEFKEGCDKPFFVLADREMIRQVLTNLITNSIKYGKEGGETVTGLYDMNENILVEVSDNGIGIEQRHLPRIFERFYRVDEDRSREQGGSGLGLSIVKHIIEAHDQTINVRSTPGIGSTFGFTLKKM
jgi:two-component system phosphate regulon sensor histidine kinase PhoR